MLKFKFLLWALTKLLQRAINNDPACAEYVKGKALTFQIQTRDGVGRHFTIEHGAIGSSAGTIPSPQFTMTFRDAAKGYAVLSAKNGKDAFLNALHNGDLDLKGDFVEIMWFQGLTDRLNPKRA